MVFDDLKIAHPDIESITEEINIHLLGHGMISPVPGFIFGEAKKEAAKNINNKIFFSHSDLSGISIFEEAFHQGINIVNQIVDGYNLGFINQKRIVFLFLHLRLLLLQLSFYFKKF